MAAKNKDKFPISHVKFEVEFKGEGWSGSQASFYEISGLDQEYQPLEYRTGVMPELVTTKRLGLMKTGTVSFKRGVMKGLGELNKLIAKAYKKESFYSTSTERLNITVNLCDEKGKPVITWKIKNAVPTKVAGASLKADTNEVAIEQIDFVHEGIEAEHK